MPGGPQWGQSIGHSIGPVVVVVGLGVGVVGAADVVSLG